METASPTQENPRDILFKGAHNFRDLGGYRTRDGRTVRWGRLFRSAELSALTHADLDLLEGMNLSVIYDLRSGKERSGRPSKRRDESAIRRVHRDYDHSGADLRSIMNDPAVNIAKLHGMMIALYRRLPEEQADSFRDVFRILAAGDTPLLFHCAAGKDRTGALAALILELLGVPRDMIMADFTLTDRTFGHNRERFLRYGRREGIDDSVWEPLLRADPSYLVTMFEMIDVREGGVAGYFRWLGLTDADIIAIRKHLLEN